MKRHLGFFAAALLVAVALQAGWSQEASSGGTESVRVDVDRAVQRALSGHPRVRAARARLSSAEAEHGEVWTEALPEVSFSGGYARLNPREAASVETPMGSVKLGDAIDESYRLSVDVAQPLFTGGRILSSVRAARARQEAAEIELRVGERALALETIRTFWQLVEARERIGVIEERRVQHERRLGDTRNRLDQGIATENEVLEVEMAIAELDAELSAAEDRSAQMGDRLLILMGEPVDRELRLDYELEESKRLGGRKAAADDAAQGRGARPDDHSLVLGRPDVLAAERRVEAARHAARASRSTWYPQISLTGSYTYARPNPDVFPPEEEFEESWEIGITGRIPLGQAPQTVFRVRGAAGGLATAQAERAESVDAAVVSLRAAERSFRSSQDRVEAARAVVRRARANERTVRDRYDNGLVVTADLLDAEALTLEAELRLTRARIEREIARYELLYERGDPLPW